MLDALPPEYVAIAALTLTTTAAYLRNNDGAVRRKAIELETVLRRYARHEFGVPSPEVQGIDREEIDAALQTAIPAYDGTDDPIRVVYSDGTYLAPVETDTHLLAAAGRVPALFPYRPARYDCENFAGAYRALAAFLLGVNSVGVVYDWSAGHAYNVVVTAGGGVRFYEPQDGEWVAIGEGNYTLENALVVF